MVAALTLEERQRAIAVSALLALCGLAMAIVGGDDPFGIHGVLVMLFGLAIMAVVLSNYFAPGPSSTSSRCGTQASSRA